MNKSASPIGQSEFFNQEYIPTKTFMEYMQKRNNFPYASEISFTPYLNKLNALSHEGCTYTKSAITPMFKDASFLTKIKEGELEEMDAEHIQSLLGRMFPYMFLNEQKSFIASPFKKKLYFQTPTLIEIFNSGDWLIKLDLLEHKENMITSTIRAGAFLLKKYYDIDMDDPHSMVVTLKNVKNGLEKHFEIQIKNDFVEAELLQPLKKLNKQEISRLLNNIYDESVWLEAFPPENFKFKGFLIATFHDVTSLETMSILKNKITLSEEEMSPEYYFPFIEQQLRNYLQMPELRIGMVMITFAEFFQGQAYSFLGTNDIEYIRYPDGSPSIYDQAFEIKSPLLFDDLTQLDPSSPIVASLLKNNIKGLILLPLMDSEGKLSSILEIGIAEVLKFNALTLLQLKEFFNLMALGTERYMQELDNMISMFIQQQFTSIHSSVKWKFQEVATKYEVQKSLPGFDGTIDPIVFEDVYPLYGQADIVSSSKLRNESIQIDLTENLKRVLRLMEQWDRELPFHLMEAYILKVKTILERISTEFISSDESLIVEILSSEIHPLLKQLISKHNTLSRAPYDEYLNELDPDLGIIYKKRKDYEQSVSQLNSAISHFMEKDNDKMQKVMPHYFEKYKTDGVEYNIYLGESILKEGGFSIFYLKNFRIWQLVNACEVTRLVEDLSYDLPVPLKTAQLLFVYNSSLSIRFRMDEKQFDVDGSYNVRYEILKKRIDKAVIKGTSERLTVAGKIAIVYLQEKDRLEYLEYLEFLKKKGYILPEIEDVELEKLQGAEGLKALRITVNLQAD